MKNQQYAYIRVSSRDQNEDRQLISMNEIGILPKHTFIDKQSGKDFNRPAYKRMMKKLRRGDHIFVKSIDRLGRNYEDIMEQWRIITKEVGADITILDMPLLDTTNCKDLLGTFISDIVLQLLSFVAENERTNIHKRQAEGIAAAHARGVRFGKPATKWPEDFPKLYSRWLCGELSATQLAALCEVSSSTIYNKLKTYRNFVKSEPV